MQLTDVIPWGRSLDEYRRMFLLSPDDLGGRILGCGDGRPASMPKRPRFGTQSFRAIRFILSPANRSRIVFAIAIRR